MFVKTDAGKTNSAYSNERNDCAVRAYSLFTNVPYDESYTKFERFGRKSNQGTTIECIDSILSVKYTRVNVSISINNLLKTYPRGKVFILKKDMPLFQLMELSMIM